MKKISVSIEGIVPILFNRFFDVESLDTPKATKKTTKQKIVDIGQKLYADPEGFIGIPMENIKKCLLEGARFAGVKIGKKSAEPYIRPTVWPDPGFIRFAGELREPDGVHVCAGRIPPGPRGHGALIRRPYLKPGWKLDFNLVLLDDRIRPDMVEIALAEAGLMVGLLDHRPEFGRFKIARFEVENEK